MKRGALSKVEAKYGNNMIIQHRDAVDPKIILVAHIDTIFPIGTTAKRPFKIDGNRAYGPGVVDMKASQVELIFCFEDIARPWC
jgi:glutamate carboxypeptidase